MGTRNPYSANNERPIRWSVPFLKDGSILYLSGGQSPAADKCMEFDFEYYSHSFRLLHHKLVFLPRLFEELSPELRAYLFPGLDAPDADTVQRRIQEEHFGFLPQSGFIRCKGHKQFFYAISETDSMSQAALEIEEYIRFLNDERMVDIRTSIQKRKPARKKEELNPNPLFEDYEPLEINEKEIPDIEPVIRHLPGKLMSDELLDDRDRVIVKEIRDLQERLGISFEEFESYFALTVKLSRLQITRSGKIFLIDFNNREVTMTTIAKALFFLYLKHPEGISFYDLPDHRDELMDLYMEISGRDDVEAIGKSMDDLVNRQENSINVNVSRVKSAFTSVINKHIARFYYIDGPQGGVKKILIDRYYVIWEH